MSDPATAQPVSHYLDYLPAVFRENEPSAAALGRFLLAFEQIMDGKDGKGSLANVVSAIAEYFDPQTTPLAWLAWLAGWVALDLQEGWTPQERRDLISKIAEAYRYRGTPSGLSTALSQFSHEGRITIFEFEQLANYFQVELVQDSRDPNELWRRQAAAWAIIQQEKPAHTYCALQFRVPTMRIGYHSTVGVDTLLGTEYIDLD